MVEINKTGSPERRERIHPNRLLNDFVTYRIFPYLSAVGIIDDLRQFGEAKIQTSSRIRKVGLDHLMGIGALTNGGDFYKIASLPDWNKVRAGHKTISALADIQRDSASGLGTARKLAKERGVEPYLTTYAPHSLMLSSYDLLLLNLSEVELGRKEYGLGKEIYRSQPDNSDGAGAMMMPVSTRVANSLVEKNQNAGLVDYLKRLLNKKEALLGLGSGNASFLAASLKAYDKEGLDLPRVLATDIDPNTRETAEKLFKDKGYEENFNWMRLDMGEKKDLENAKKLLESESPIIHIGYILHESRELAKKTLEALSEVFPEATLALTEYYYQDQITDEVPLWFQTIHGFSGQELFRYQELKDFLKSFGYKEVEEELVHLPLKHKEEPLNSTTFWKKVN